MALDSDLSNSETTDNTENETMNAPNDINAQQYYSSEFWEQLVDCTLAAIGEIDQSQHPKAQASYAQSQSQCSKIQTHSLVQQLSIHVHPVRSHQITSWHFPPQYSQSTLNGRLARNAPTLIALTFRRLYFSSPESLIVSQPPSKTWVYRVLAAIMIGQQLYDKFTSNPGQFYGVREAALNMGQTRALVHITISTGLPCTIKKSQYHQHACHIILIKLVTTIQLASMLSITKQWPLFQHSKELFSLTAISMEPVEHFWPWLQLTQHGKCYLGLRL